MRFKVKCIKKEIKCMKKKDLTPIGAIEKIPAAVEGCVCTG